MRGTTGDARWRGPRAAGHATKTEAKMSLWVVRAGRRGEQQETALKEHLVCHAWNELPDYSGYRTKDELRQLYVQTYQRESEKQVISGLGQVWRFARKIQKGDLVALTLRT